MEDLVVLSDELLDNNNIDWSKFEKVVDRIYNKEPPDDDDDVDDYVSELYKYVKESKRVKLSYDNDSNVFACGGFGCLFKCKLSMTRKENNEIISKDVAVKLVRPRNNSHGIDNLNEITITKQLAPISHTLLPALKVVIDPRSSETYIAFPSGLIDLSKMIKALKVGGNEYYLLPQTLNRWCSEILDAIGFLHSNGVVHGDIKPGNIILFPKNEKIFKIVTSLFLKICKLQQSSSPDCCGDDRKRRICCKALAIVMEFTTLKLSDFGLSAFVEIERQGVVDRSGSFSYTSPYRPLEVWSENRWSYSADIWAFGVTAFEMGFGKTLFSENRKTPRGEYEKKGMYIKAHEDFCKKYNLFVPITPPPILPPSNNNNSVVCNFNEKEWMSNNITDDFRSFIASMLQLSPISRLKAYDLSEHAYMSNSKYIIAPPLSNLTIPPPPLSPPSISSSSSSSSMSSIDASVVKNDCSLTASEQFGIDTLGLDDNSKCEYLMKRIQEIIPSDVIVQKLTLWIAINHITTQNCNRSVRIKRLCMVSYLSICACIAAKILRRTKSIKEADRYSASHNEHSLGKDKSGRVYAPPSPARDERAICDQLSFKLFPFQFI